MNIRCFAVSWIALNALLFATPGGANNDFQQWLQQQATAIETQKKEFQEYKDIRDKEFTAFLKAQWKSVDLVKGEVRDEMPKPDVMPVAPPVPVEDFPQKTGLAPVPLKMPEPELIKMPVVLPPVARPEGQQLSVDFYGRTIHFFYDPRLRKGLKSRIDKNVVSDYWSAVSQTHYETLLQQLSAQKKSLQLNDWAYASLVDKVARKINKNRNESTLLSWFLLLKSGYKARIAYNDINIYLLVPSRHEMFEVSYFTFSGMRYYAVEFDGDDLQMGPVYTYDSEYPDATKEFDMQVSSIVASSDLPEHRHLSFKFDGKEYNVSVTYDRGRIKFFSGYPQLNLGLYFTSGVYQSTATPLQRQLAENMRGMTEPQAVNFLLRFVQTALQYETDEQQFGKENYLFPEETLFYPYSDCEDRAVLFAWLVKSLLGLDVVGLDYPGHVAAAVNFNEEVAGDSVSYKGKRYIVTDPTYINANAGMTMPDFKQYTPEVIAY